MTSPRDARSTPARPDCCPGGVFPMKNSQQIVAEFVARHGLETDVAHRLLDAVSELGEVAKEALKGSDYGKRKFAATDAWRGELGDVLFPLLCVANSTGVDLDAALREALEKYERRLAAKGDAGSAKRVLRRRMTS